MICLQRFPSNSAVGLSVGGRLQGTLAQQAHPCPRTNIWKPRSAIMAMTTAMPTATPKVYPWAAGINSENTDQISETAVNAWTRNAHWNGYWMPWLRVDLDQALGAKACTICVQARPCRSSVQRRRWARRAGASAGHKWRTTAMRQHKLFGQVLRRRHLECVCFWRWWWPRHSSLFN